MCACVGEQEEKRRENEGENGNEVSVCVHGGAGGEAERGGKMR